MGGCGQGAVGPVGMNAAAAYRAGIGAAAVCRAGQSWRGTGLHQAARRLPIASAPERRLVSHLAAGCSWANQGAVCAPADLRCLSHPPNLHAPLADVHFGGGLRAGHTADRPGAPAVAAAGALGRRGVDPPGRRQAQRRRVHRRCVFMSCEVGGVRWGMGGMPCRGAADACATIEPVGHCCTEFQTTIKLCPLSPTLQPWRPADCRRRIRSCPASCWLPSGASKRWPPQPLQCCS